MRERVEWALESGVIVGALATIPLTIAQERGAGGLLVVVGDWAVWSIFLLEYGIMLALSTDRWSYARRHWLNLAVVVLSFPALPTLLALVRLVRLVRLLRLVRLIAVPARGVRALGGVLGRRGLLYVAAVTGFLVLAGAAVITVLEPQAVQGSLWAGIWWAIVTVTTVGYGDITPVTVWGRVAAVALMLTGLALLSTLAASIAAYFVGEDERAEHKRVAERLERIEALLEELRAGGPETDRARRREGNGRL